MRTNYTKKSKFQESNIRTGNYIEHYVTSGLGVDRMVLIKVTRRGSGYVIESTDHKDAVS